MHAAILLRLPGWSRAECRVCAHPRARNHHRHPRALSSHPRGHYLFGWLLLCRCCHPPLSLPQRRRRRRRRRITGRREREEGHFFSGIPPSRLWSVCLSVGRSVVFVSSIRRTEQSSCQSVRCLFQLLFHTPYPSSSASFDCRVALLIFHHIIFSDCVSRWTESSKHVSVTRPLMHKRRHRLRVILLVDERKENVTKPPPPLMPLSQHFKVNSAARAVVALLVVLVT